MDRIRRLRRVIHDRMAHATLSAQFLGYLVIGGVCALINLLVFWILFRLTSTWVAAAIAFIAAAAFNYWLCISLLFKRVARSSTWFDLTTYGVLVAAVANIDAFSTMRFMAFGARPAVAKISATFVAFVFNFIGRRFVIFSGPRGGE